MCPTKSWKMGQAFYRIILTLAFILVQTCDCQTSSQGVLEVKLNYFHNDLGLTETDDCCQGDWTGSSCTDSCRTFITICAKQYQVTVTKDPPCIYGDITTPLLGNNSITFQRNMNSFSNPVSLPFNWVWPDEFSIVISVWHDRQPTGTGPTAGSPRLLLFSDSHSFQSLPISEDWESREVRKAEQELSYAVRAICPPDHYGPHCTNCVSRDDNFGHYSCAEDGTKVCLEGWQGIFCDEPKCLPGCHKDHGSCSEPGECNCGVGYQGEFCDECVPYPGCDHGSCDLPFTCNCQAGWGGEFCNLDLNYCTTKKPCKNGATCENAGEGSYLCTCAPGFTGTNCEQEVNTCEIMPCLNGGTCTDLGDHYECQCPEGFQGSHCESSARSCNDEPCKNGASCTSTLDGMSYECKCLPGYHGFNCEREENECASQPCENGGRCIDELKGYTCNCPRGFEGKNCEINSDNCRVNPCINGKCVDLVNNFQCNCFPGYYGNLCQFQDTSATDPSLSPPPPSTTSNGTASPQAHAIVDNSVMNKQLALLVSLGVGIPCIIIIAVLIFVLVRRRQHNSDSDSAARDNQHNEDVVRTCPKMNNYPKNKAHVLDIDDVTVSNLKVTNEKAPNRTLVLDKNNLNSDNKPVSKLYDKDLNVGKVGTQSKDSQQEGDHRSNTAITSPQPSCSSQSSPCTASSRTELSYQYSSQQPSTVHTPSLHAERPPSNNSSIFFVENCGYKQQGMLATEV